MHFLRLVKCLSGKHMANLFEDKTIKKIQIVIAAIFCITGGISVSAQNYIPVDNVSSVKIIIRNVGMATEGKISGLEGSIVFNPNDLKNASFAVTVDANSINTDIDVRDSALKTAEYLDAKKFPRISFVSKQISQANKSAPFMVKGILTIKGISKEISFPFAVAPKNDGLLFTGECKVNRLQYKIGVGSVVLSDNMTISLVVFAKKGG
jgi:polyisoprenoid-binding protein YceI